MMGNMFEKIPKDLSDEVFEDILKSKNIRIERIISKGHKTELDWYDQDENEWVMLLSGEAEILFEDGSVVELKSGDYIDIKAHQKHKVLWTKEDELSVWLAVFY